MPKLTALDISAQNLQRAPGIPATSVSFQSQPSAPAKEIEITASDSYSQETLESLEDTAKQAITYFRENFGPVPGPLQINVGGAALRTGYNAAEDMIYLPELANVHNAGLDSKDVINHEIFHALALRAYPTLPKPDTADVGQLALHEALADFFAHQLSPDEHFGEGYRTDQAYLREYRNDLKISLTSGGHAQGNAITSLLIEQDVTNLEIRKFLEGGDFRLEALGEVAPHLKPALDADRSLSLTETVSAPYTSSPTNRYWLKDEPFEVSFTGNQEMGEAFPDLKVVWTDKRGFPTSHYTFEDKGDNRFEVSGLPDAKTEKAIARFYDDDRLLGFRPFYFGVRSST